MDTHRKKKTKKKKSSGKDLSVPFEEKKSQVWLFNERKGKPVSCEGGRRKELL